MAETTTTPAAPATDGRLVTGIVTRDKNAKTRRVEIDRLVRHPKYGKFVKRRTVCYMHDEHNESHLGDTVEAVECRPMSKLKRWNLVRVVTKAPSRTLSNLEGAVAGADAGKAAPKPAAK
jgi:small subunit ribosomal protein S17